MDGTLVDNTPVHIRAFEIFCERYGIRDWKEKLGQAYGMGNDDIMRLIMPAEVIREKGLAALAEEKESIYREIYAPEIVPMPGLTDLLQKAPRCRHTLRRRFVGLQAQCGFRAGKMPYRALFRRQDQRRHGLALQTRPGDLPYGRRGPGAACGGMRRLRRRPGGDRSSTQGRSRTYRGAGHDARPRSAGADRCGQGHRRFPRHHRPRRFAEITRAQKPDRPSAISAAPPPRRPAVVIDGFRATPARQRSGRGGSAASPIARHTDATCRRPYPNAPYTRYPTAIPIKKRRGWLFFAGRAYHTEKIDTFARF